LKSNFLETIKSVDGKLFHLSYHQKRYENVLSSLGVKNAKKLQEYIKPPKTGIFRCRIVYNADEITVSYHEYKKRDIRTLKLIFNNEIDYAVKSTSREELESLYTLREECDDILIVKNLLVTDTSIANIAFYSEGKWITPRNPLLKGTTRARLLDEGRLIEADIKVQELRNFSKVALLNAMIDFDILEECEFLI
jgi:4-amino-4-deoxychorismate lyase